MLGKGTDHNAQVGRECLLLGDESRYLLVRKRPDLPSSETREATLANVGYWKNLTLALPSQIGCFVPVPATPSV